MLAGFAKVAKGAKIAEDAKIAKVARFPETMDRGVQKRGHDMQVGDSFDGGQYGDGLKEAMRGRL